MRMSSVLSPVERSVPRLCVFSELLVATLVIQCGFILVLWFETWEFLKVKERTSCVVSMKLC